MKVRHKQTGEVFKDGWLHPQEHVWKVITNHDERKEFMEWACESLPTEPRWQDVTGECEPYTYPSGAAHGIKHQNRDITGAGYGDGYRLRKVEWTEPYDHGVGAIAYRYAFIVERKVK